MKPTMHKQGPSRTGMTMARWAYLKALRPSFGKYLHISNFFVPNPAAAIAKANGKPFFGPQHVLTHGKTYNIGRDKAERERAAMRANGGVQ